MRCWLNPCLLLLYMLPAGARAQSAVPAYQQHIRSASDLYDKLCRPEAAAGRYDSARAHCERALAALDAAERVAQQGMEPTWVSALVTLRGVVHDALEVLPSQPAGTVGGGGSRTIIKVLPRPPHRLDQDHDNVPDNHDLCPFEPGSLTGRGCPGRTFIIVSSDKNELRPQIHFAPRQTSALPLSIPILDAVAAALQTDPTIKLQIVGHTDDQEDPVRSKHLSAHRALSVVQELRQRGISLARLNMAAHGGTRPIRDNLTETGRQLNRRVEFIITEGGARPSAPQVYPDLPGPRALSMGPRLPG